MMDAQSLHNILLHTFSTDANARKAAEEAIANLHNVRGSILMLIQVAMEESVNREVRQAAAVSLKNLVHKYWEGQEDPSTGQWSPVIPDEEKRVSRQNALEALLMTHDTSLRSLLAETVNLIARVDFPTHWPTLVDELCKNVQSGDANRIINALLALRKLVKNFEYRSDERREPLYAIVQVVFPMLRAMLTQLQANNSLEGARMMHLILKTYWSCVQCTLPPFAAQQDEVAAWMELFRLIIAKPLPEASEGLEPLGQPIDEDERNAWPWWKLKKWAMQILCRFYTRWGNPKTAEDDNVAMATFFRNQIAPGLLPCVLETLALRKNGRFCTDRVLQLALVFLQEAIDSKVAYKLLKPHLGFLLFEVIHPVLCLTPKDLQLWEDDPHEFVRKTNDVFEDFLDPVYAAENLLADLCTKRGKDCLQNVLVFYNEILTAYASEPDASKRDYIQKDAALHALFSLDTVLTKSSTHKANVEPMIVHHIVPEFQNPHGFLRLRACKLFSRKFMESIVFQDEQTLVQIMEGILASMFDAELPVRIEAAKTIRFVVMYPHSDTVLQVLRPRLPQVLEQFFKLMDEIGNDEVVVALEHIIDRFSEEIGPFAVELVTKLVECFQQFTLGASEDDEDASLAAVSCLDTINTVLMSIHNHPELYNLLLPVLVPVLQRILTDYDFIEYMESGLDILGSIAFYSQAIQPALWSLFPLLFSSFDQYAADYITSFVPVIDNFIGRDIDGFLNGQVTTSDNQRLPFVELVFGMAKKVFESQPMEEIDVCAACRLFYSLLHNCFGKIDGCIPTIVNMVTQKIVTEELTDATHRNLFGVIASALHYNPQLTVQTMVQTNLIDQVFKLWLTSGDVVQKFATFLDRKLFVLGMMSLLKLPNDQLPVSISTHLKPLVQQTMKMLVSAIQNPAPGIHNDDDDEDEEGNLENLLDQGGYDSDEDAHDVADDQYLQILKELREEAALGHYGMYDDEGDEEYSSLLDQVDEVEFFLSTLQGFATTHSAEYQSWQLEADADAQQAMALFTQEHAKRQQEKQQDHQ